MEMNSFYGTSWTGINYTVCVIHVVLKSPWLLFELKLQKNSKSMQNNKQCSF